MSCLRAIRVEDVIPISSGGVKHEGGMVVMYQVLKELCSFAQEPPLLFGACGLALLVQQSRFGHYRACFNLANLLGKHRDIDIG
jgi:hypothetical protein